MNDYAVSQGDVTAPLETVDAEFQASELLLVMLGVADAAMHRRVREVARHAADSPVLHDVPKSNDDEVLTVSFERVFTRAEVVAILNVSEGGRA